MKLHICLHSSWSHGGREAEMVGLLLWENLSMKIIVILRERLQRRTRSLPASPSSLGYHKFNLTVHAQIFPESCVRPFPSESYQTIVPHLFSQQRSPALLLCGATSKVVIFLIPSSARAVGGLSAIANLGADSSENIQTKPGVHVDRGKLWPGWTCSWSG